MDKLIITQLLVSALALAGIGLPVVLALAWLRRRTHKPKVQLGLRCVHGKRMNEYCYECAVVALDQQKN